MVVVLLVFLGLFTILPGGPQLTRQFNESLFGLLLINILISWKLLKKFHWSVGVAFLFASASSLFVHYNPQVYRNMVRPDLAVGLQDHIYTGYVILLVFTCLALVIKKDDLEKIKVGLVAGAVLDSFAILFKKVVFNSVFALMGNSAIDASFIACAMPLACPLLWPVFVFAIMLTGSSTGYAAIAVAMGVYVMIHDKKRGFVWALALSAGIAVLSKLMLGSELTNPNGRYNVWKISYDFVMQEGDRWLGAGLGSFSFWGPLTQSHVALARGADPHRTMDLFIWAHNDWLQVFFELGFVGLASVLILFGFMIYKSWKKRPDLTPAIATFGFIALTQMPLRVFVLQLLGVTLAALTFDKGEECSHY